MAKKKADAHGAAQSGLKGEQILKNALAAHGLSLLKKKNEFKGVKGAGCDVYERVINLKSPYDNGYFTSDGFCPELGCVFEIKYGRAHGTTEEKIFFDLEKIRDGVYDTGYPLVYVFWGTPEVASSSNTGRCWAKVFRDKVEKENLPVKVVFATTDNGFEKFITEAKQARGIL